MDSDIPDFDEAISQFRTFLRRQHHPTEIAWVFREDFYFQRQDRLCVHFPPPAENEALSRWMFEAGRARGLVEVVARCSTDSITFATVWFPLTADEELQGWDQGFRLSAVDPLPEARMIGGGLRWRLRRLLPAYKDNQEYNDSVATRAMIVARQATAPDTDRPYASPAEDRHRPGRTFRAEC